MNRTTRQQVEAQARRLARALGYKEAHVSAGSKVYGVSWTVVLTHAPTYAEAWSDAYARTTHTLSLSGALTAAQAYDRLHSMAEGAEMANDSPSR